MVLRTLVHFKEQWQGAESQGLEEVWRRCGNNDRLRFLAALGDGVCV